MAEKLLQILDPDKFTALVTGFINRSEPDILSFEAFDQAVQRLAQDSIAETIKLCCLDITFRLEADMP